MLQSLYQNWQKCCFPIALFTTIVLCSSVHQIGWLFFCIWMQFPIYLLHETEEHEWPGGFKNFINLKVFQSGNPEMPLSAADVFWINIPFIWMVFPICAVIAQHGNIHFGAVLPAFALFNATLHIIAACVKRCYNPGLFVSVFINYPTGIYILMIMSRTGALAGHTILHVFLFALVAHASMIVPMVIKYKKFRSNIDLNS